MALYCIISEIKRDIGRKLQFFRTPLHLTFPLGGPRQNVAIMFGMEKLEWYGYPMVKSLRICLAIFK